MGLRLADLSADLREHYEERAAIIEFDAGMPRRAAEAMAMQDVLAIDAARWNSGASADRRLE